MVALAAQVGLVPAYISSSYVVTRNLSILLMPSESYKKTEPGRQAPSCQTQIIRIAVDKA